MEANELSIGNFVNFPETGETELTNVVNIGFVNNSYFINWKFKIEDCKPIPLTEEWLLKFGFKLDKISDFKWYVINDISISFKEERVAQKVGEMYNRFEIPKYVHQLQNLYFSLTGEELEVKK